MSTTSIEYRLYEAGDLGADGYPPEWHATIKHAVREEAGHRCVRCSHPYRVGQSKPDWSPCDERCTHGGPLRYRDFLGAVVWEDEYASPGPPSKYIDERGSVEAAWRVLTVHHLDGSKGNCRWWNLIAVCQRCHLWLQGTVRIEQVYPFEHDEYFKPYAAGWYAFAYLGEDLDRPTVETRLDELLALERAA